MQTKKLPIAQIKENPNNPRLIRNDKFHKLVKSIQEFPEMMDVRPIVVNKDYVILGGNMRWKAAVEAGLTQIPVKIVNWDEQKQHEFLIKDNVSFGEWDWDILANEWDALQLGEWGIDLWKPEYEPNLEPSSDHGLITATDVDRAESKIGIEQNFSESLDVICPECGAEFEIKRQ
jgi:hypothetical protein